MKRSISLLLFASCATLALAQSASTTTPATPAIKADPEGVAAKDPNKVVATVNGKQLTAKQAVDLLKLVPPEQRSKVTNLQALVQQLYMVSDLAKKAEAEKLDEQSPYKQQLEWSRDTVLAQAYVGKLAHQNNTTPQDPKQYYDTHKPEFDRASVSGIVVAFNPPGTPASAGGVARTEEQAKDKANDIEKKLKGGADFATVARTDSDDSQSAPKGGELGTLSAATPNVPQDMKDVIFNKLQPGQVSDPVRGPNAYYILKLNNRTQESFDQAKQSIAQELQANQERAATQQVVSQYKLQVDDPAFFGSSNTTSANKIPSLAKPGGTTPTPSSQQTPKP